ncbi:hypothetical protein [Fodinicola feengrottensis]|uniref:hypothetical protein n=1 Tax=Fodinicola feengrottensis TaxID=435914 RepID=UPI0013D3E81F|nr:hypothetical protein [Fodinicola feengrottensis]
MIVCKTCGEQNENEARFCANCSSFLEWDGQAVPTGPVPVHLLDRTQPDQGTAPGAGAPAVPGAPPGERPPIQPTTVINVPREMLNRPSRGLSGTTPTMPPPPPTPAAAASGRLSASADRPVGWRLSAVSAAATSAAAAVPAVSAASGASRCRPAGPAAGAGRQPSDEQTRRRRRPASSSTPQPGVAPGEIPCRVCGTGNPPDRQFCRTCGTSTVDNVAPRHRNGSVSGAGCSAAATGPWRPAPGTTGSASPCT